MFSNSLLNDVSNMLESGGILFHHVVTQGYVVGQVSLIAQYLHGSGELGTCLLISVLLQGIKILVLILICSKYFIQFAK